MHESERMGYLILGIRVMLEDQGVSDNINCKYEWSHQTSERVGSMNLEEVGGWRDEGRGHGQSFSPI